MEKALMRADELGVTIALEPVNRYEINFLNSCEQIAEVIRSLNHPKLMMMPDVFHMNILKSRCLVRNGFGSDFKAFFRAGGC